MKRKTLWIAVIAFSLFVSCEYIRMDPPTITGIRVYNNSDTKIMPLSIWSVTDTLLSSANHERSVESDDYSSISWVKNWQRKPGITLFIFDYDYFWRNYISGLTPDQFLSEDSLLAKYIIPMNVLRDSMNYEIYYPDSTRVYKSNF